MQLIADILSFQDNQQILSEYFKQSYINWDPVVIIASQHLMLPALYCRLKQKGLLELIPSELNIYLEEIASINRGRNEVLLKEVHEISEILNKESIEHVFLKGTVLLASDSFKDHAERMIGDIDILVVETQIHFAFDVMTKNGYTQSLERDYKSDTGRHLQRQVFPGKYGAIELHSDILQYTHKHLLKSKEVLSNKRIINGVSLPSVEDCIEISILALQINDHAHVFGYLQLKTIYDCLVLNLGNKQNVIWHLSEKKHSQSFLQLSSIFFKELSPNQSSTYSKILLRYFMFKLKNPKSGFLISSFMKTTKINIHRLKLFVKNKHYRSYILKNKILATKGPKI